MIPVIIENLIGDVTNKKIHTDKRQFYYTTLVNIRKAIDSAIKEYEKERNFK